MKGRARKKQGKKIVGKAIKRVGQVRKYQGKSEPQPPLTKSRFERLLTKASQPVSEWQHGQEGSETSNNHPSDGCSETHTNQDKTEDKED